MYLGGRTSLYEERELLTRFFRENEVWAVYFRNPAVRAALQLPYVKIQRQMDCILRSLWTELCFITELCLLLT